MEAKDWVFLVLQVIALYLTNKQNKLQARAMNIESRTWGARLSAAARRYWPLATMVLLVAATWVPYVLRLSSPPTPVQQQPPIVLSQWGVESAIGSPVPSVAYAVITPTPFAEKYQDKYEVLIVVRVQDDRIDALSDQVIDKSNPFQIGAAKIEVSFSQPALARFNQPRTVAIFAAIVPKGTDLSEISTLGSITTHGGVILGLAGVVVPAVPNARPL